MHTNSLNNTHLLDQKSDQSNLPNKERKTVKFRHLTIKNLKPSKKRTILWCQGMTNFGIRISPSGSKSWIYEYRIENTGRRITLGKFPKMSLAEATQKYGEFKKSVDMGIDPLSERNKMKKKEDEELTVSELVDLFIEHSKKVGKKSWKTELRELSKDLLPIFGNKKITKVNPKELAKMFSHIIVVREAPGAASHLYSYVRRLFNFAAEMQLMRRRDNPCLDIKLKIPKNRRQRHLNPEEIYKFWHSLDKIEMADISRLGLRFLLCTVARSNEVRNMKWSHVDLNARIWTQPTSKNGRMHRVYLGDLAMRILNEAKEYTDCKGYVFGSTGKISTCGIDKENLGMLSAWAFSQPIRRNFEAFNIEERFYPHDLRRTGATIIAGLFGRRDFASMALNHTISDVTGIYDQYTYDREKKMTLNALNKAIELIINSPNIESVSNFEELRNKIIQPINPRQGQGAYIQQDFQASFSSPVSYKLCVSHDGSSNGF